MFTDSLTDPRPHLDNVPAREDVTAIVTAAVSISPTLVLGDLMKLGHSRAEAQRGMQRALASHLIQLNLNLEFERGDCRP